MFYFYFLLYNSIKLWKCVTMSSKLYFVTVRGCDWFLLEPSRLPEPFTAKVQPSKIVIKPISLTEYNSRDLGWPKIQWRFLTNIRKTIKMTSLLRIFFEKRMMTIQPQWLKSLHWGQSSGMKTDYCFEDLVCGTVDNARIIALVFGYYIQA